MDESFFFVESIGTGSGVGQNSEPTVRALTDGDIVVLSENHFAIPQKSINYLKTPKGFARYQSRITLKQLSVLWQVYGGSDFTPPTSVNIRRSGTSPTPSAASARDMRRYTSQFQILSTGVSR